MKTFSVTMARLQNTLNRWMNKLTGAPTRARILSEDDIDAHEDWKLKEEERQRLLGKSPDEDGMPIWIMEPRPSTPMPKDLYRKLQEARERRLQAHCATWTSVLLAPVFMPSPFEMNINRVSQHVVEDEEEEELDDGKKIDGYLKDKLL